MVELVDLFWSLFPSSLALRQRRRRKRQIFFHEIDSAATTILLFATTTILLFEITLSSPCCVTNKRKWGEGGECVLMSLYNELCVSSRSSCCCSRRHRRLALYPPLLVHAGNKTVAPFAVKTKNSFLSIIICFMCVTKRSKKVFSIFQSCEP
jgi:hypothetical protein